MPRPRSTGRPDARRPRRSPTAKAPELAQELTTEAERADDLAVTVAEPFRCDGVDGRTGADLHELVDRVAALVADHDPDVVVPRRDATGPPTDVVARLRRHRPVGPTHLDPHCHGCRLRSAHQQRGDDRLVPGGAHRRRHRAAGAGPVRNCDGGSPRDARRPASAATPRRPTSTRFSPTCARTVAEPRATCPR